MEEQMPGLKAIYGKLQTIQHTLKAPKNLDNEFGGFKYRSLEGVLTALKPILLETETAIILTDELVLIGDRYYIKATATLTDGDNKIEATSYARESLERKGFDEAQLTGSASSYARKYAVNGLFATDDNMDPDAKDNKKDPKPGSRSNPKPKLINKEQLETIDLLVKTAEPDMKKFLAYFKIKEIKELQAKDFKKAVALLKKKMQ